MQKNFIGKSSTIREEFLDVFLAILNPDKLTVGRAFLYKNGINSNIVKKFLTSASLSNYKEFLNNSSDFQLKEQKPMEVFKKINYHVDGYGTQNFSINITKTGKDVIKNRKYTLVYFIKFKKEINGNICTYIIYKHKNDFRIHIKCEITDTEEKVKEAQDLAYSFLWTLTSAKFKIRINKHIFNEFIKYFDDFSIFICQETKYGSFIKQTICEYWVKSDLDIDIWKEIFEDNFQDKGNKRKFFCSAPDTTIISRYILDDNKIYLAAEQSNPYTVDESITKIDKVYIRYSNRCKEDNILFDVYKDMNTGEVYAIFSNYYSDCSKTKLRKAILADFLNKTGILPKLIIEQDQ